MSAVQGILTIPQNGYRSNVFDKRAYAGMLMVLVPSGLQGVLAVRAANVPDTSSPGRVYDTDGALVQINPSGKTLPAWFVISADVFPAHYVWFETYTDATEATPQNQSAERTLVVMGVYNK